MEAALEHPRLKEAENVFLDVWEHNHGAQRFYRRYRFAVIGAHVSRSLQACRRTATSS